MKVLFYLLTFLPIRAVRLVTSLCCKFGLHKNTKAFKVSLININICYPGLKEYEKINLATKSIIETIVSGYETLQSWSRPIHISGDKIYRVENNYLLSENIRNKKGLIFIAIHNRSVDMLLKWVNSKTQTTTLYKKVKNIQNEELNICFILSSLSRTSDCFADNYLENLKAEKSRISLLKNVKKQNKIKITLKSRRGSFLLERKKKFYNKFKSNTKYSNLKVKELF